MNQIVYFLSVSDGNQWRCGCASAIDSGASAIDGHLNSRVDYCRPNFFFNETSHQNYQKGVLEAALCAASAIDRAVSAITGAAQEMPPHHYHADTVELCV